MADVTLEPHDPGWSHDFDRERDRIRAAADDGLLGVFHVGSTAVPELVAKPNIDIAAVYSTPTAVRDAEEWLLDEYALHSDDSERVVVARPDDTPGVFVHLQPRDATSWRHQLVFRELLREDAEAREEYEAAKIAAAAEHPNNVHAYTDTKEPVIRSLTDRAYEAGYDERIPDLSDRERSSGNP